MSDAVFPKIAMAQQRMTNLPIRDVAAAVRKEIDSLDLAGRIRPGERVAVTAGSRGIRDTLSLERVILSKSLCREAGSLEHVAVAGPLTDIPWDSADNLVSPPWEG
jgi:hypothetical protein